MPLMNDQQKLAAALRQMAVVVQRNGLDIPLHLGATIALHSAEFNFGYNLTATDLLQAAEGLDREAAADVMANSGEVSKVEFTHTPAHNFSELELRQAQAVTISLIKCAPSPDNNQAAQLIHLARALQLDELIVESLIQYSTSLTEYQQKKEELSEAKRIAKEDWTATQESASKYKGLVAQALKAENEKVGEAH